MAQKTSPFEICLFDDFRILQETSILTSNRSFKIRFDLTDFENNTSFAEYLNFRVNTNSTHFTVRYNVTSYNGTAGESPLKDKIYFCVDVGHVNTYSTNIGILLK